jgi:hypothetical protein
MKYSGSYTHDLNVGEMAEDWVYLIMNKGSNVEVKIDSMAHKTGNAYIEVYSKGRLSGITTTSADYWIYIIGELDSAVIVSVKRLKQLVKKYHSMNGYTLGGDNDTSKGVLVPLKEFVCQ